MGLLKVLGATVAIAASLVSSTVSAGCGAITTGACGAAKAVEGVTEVVADIVKKSAGG